MSAPTFETLQTYVQALIAGASALNTFAAIVLADPFLDQETARSNIAALVRVKGVCFEIGYPWIGAPSSHLDGITQIEGMFEVFTAESPEVAHTPTKLALFAEVIRAITVKPAAPGQKPARLRSAESVKMENGYILHMASFYIPLNIKPSGSLSTPQV